MIDDNEDNQEYSEARLDGFRLFFALIAIIALFSPSLLSPDSVTNNARCFSACSRADHFCLLCIYVESEREWCELCSARFLFRLRTRCFSFGEQ